MEPDLSRSVRLGHQKWEGAWGCLFFPGPSKQAPLLVPFKIGYRGRTRVSHCLFRMQHFDAFRRAPFGPEPQARRVRPATKGICCVSCVRKGSTATREAGRQQIVLIIGHEGMNVLRV
jgi:hypothetical protein